MPRIDKSSSMPMKILETQFIASGAVNHSSVLATETLCEGQMCVLVKFARSLVMHWSLLTYTKSTHDIRTSTFERKHIKLHLKENSRTLISQHISNLVLVILRD